jgi:hypothetical protein
LIDLIEELDTFSGDVALQAFDGYGQRVSAFDPDDAVIARERRRRRTEDASDKSGGANSDKAREHDVVLPACP